MKELICASQKWFKQEKNLTRFFLVALIVVIVSATGYYNYAYAEKQSGYGYGWISDTYGYGFETSSDVPAAVTNLSCNGATSTTISCNWSAVTEAADGTDLDNFENYELYYATSSGDANKDEGTLGETVAVQGTHTATVTSLSSGNTYYFAIYTVDDNDNYSAISNVPSSTVYTSSGGSGGGGGGGSYSAPTLPSTPPNAGDTTVPAAPATPATPAAPEGTGNGNAQPARPATPDLKAELNGLNLYVSLTKHLPSGANGGWEVVHFIAYGTTDQAKSLGERERGGVILDFQNVFGRMPNTDLDWEDVARMCNAHKTVQRNLDRERWAIAQFVKIYRRLPVFSVMADDMAIHYMAYALRSPDRDELVAEKNAINIFRQLYGHSPVSGSTNDWSIVRSIAYSGASK
ncbi:MAG: fibronectin type III domain-containing protein [Patescibacteria group bacterium]